MDNGQRSVVHKIALLHDQVHANLERAQQRQRNTYGKRIKKGAKRDPIRPGMVVLKKDERKQKRKRGRPGMTMKPTWPNKYK